MLSRKYLLVLACASLALMAACSGSSNNSNAGAAKNGNKPAGNSIPPNAPPGANPPTQAGSPTATVTIEEFADFQCPQCAAKNPILSEIRSMYGSRIRFIFRNFPLDIPAHDKSYDAAIAAQAAYAQGKFWEMEALLFNNQRNWTADPNFKQIWKSYAQQIGLDVNKWEDDCLGLPAKQRVDEDKKRAQGVGVSSTPTVYLNGVEFPFEKLTTDNLKAAIDAELAKAPATAPPVATNVPPANMPANSSNTASNVPPKK
ncbi:MAG: thioredoxin domain-containing protein [Acidobacteria bacterium]|nr:thioredoxin domain-containing protein [Acidobacteriota bacterium]